MKIRLIAVGTRMPRWVEDGWQEYAKRLPPELQRYYIELDIVQRFIARRAGGPQTAPPHRKRRLTGNA